MQYANRYVWLDLIRGLSALIVCAVHLRAVMYVDYSELSAAGWFDRLFYFVTSLGHQAVMVFFVLSGFFVGGSVLGRRERFSLRNYAVARLTRLWVVLIPALLFTGVVDRLFVHLAPGLLSGAYSHLLTSGPAPGAPASSSIWTLLGNLSFLQTLYVPVYGTNGPLWSLTCEFWYYVLFPLMIVGLGIAGASGRRRLGAGLLCLIALYVARPLWEGYVVWLFGVGVYLLYSTDRFRFPRWVLPGAALIFAGALAYSKSTALRALLRLPGNVVVGLAFTFFMLAIRDLGLRGRLKDGVALVARSVSEISYSLYLVHFPVVLLIYTFFYRDAQVEPAPFNLMMFGVWMGVQVLAGAAFWWLFERHTPKVRGWIMRRGG